MMVANDKGVATNLHTSDDVLKTKLNEGRKRYRFFF